MAHTKTPVALKTITEEGDGLESPECGDSVHVHYTGLLDDGTPVWSSRKMGKPVKLTLDKGPPGVKKFHAALKTMKRGEKADFIIPFVLSDLPEEETPVQVAVEMLSWEKAQSKKKKPYAKRNKRKANAAPWHGKLVPAEGLPSGWLMGKKKRTQGKGYNKYYIQPGTGKVFKSRKGVERFLKQDLGGAGNETEEDTPRSELHASEKEKDLGGAGNETEEDTPRSELHASEEKDLGGAGNETEEDTPRSELHAPEDGQIDACDEIENLQRQLRDAVNEKNKIETQYKEQLLLNNQIMEELTCEKERRQDLEGVVKSFKIAFASRQESMTSFLEDFKSKLGHLKAESYHAMNCVTESSDSAVRSSKKVS